MAKRHFTIEFAQEQLFNKLQNEGINVAVASVNEVLKVRSQDDDTDWDKIPKKWYGYLVEAEFIGRVEAQKNKAKARARARGWNNRKIIKG